MTSMTPKCHRFQKTFLRPTNEANAISQRPANVETKKKAFPRMVNRLGNLATATSNEEITWNFLRVVWKKRLKIQGTMRKTTSRDKEQYLYRLYLYLYTSFEQTMVVDNDPFVAGFNPVEKHHISQNRNLPPKGVKMVNINKTNIWNIYIHLP